MLRSIKEFYGTQLGASDGEIGRLKDFYFDHQLWAIRYLVADTGTWLPGRKVLLSPHSIVHPARDGKVLGVDLTRKQIEHSPSIETHKTVSRLYEEEYYQYYGWPRYWLGDGLWGHSDSPVAVPPAKPAAGVRPPASERQAERPDARLLSTRAVGGYHLQASDGTIGHVCDFLVDMESWAIRQLVVKTGHRFSGKEVQVPTRKVDRISYPESTVFVNLTGAEVQDSPAHLLAVIGAGV